MSAVDSVIARIGAAQHGIVAVRQVEAAGISEGAIERRAADGRLTRVHTGVYALGPGPLTRRGRWMAATLAAGAGAVLSHRSAAALLEIRTTTSGLIDVTIVGGSRRRRRGRLRLHTSGALHPDDVTSVDAVPATASERTLLDLAEVIPSQELRRAYEQAERLRILDHSNLRALVERSNGRRGLKHLLPLLAYDATAATEAWSELERLFLDLIRAAGLPDYQRNVVVDGHTVDAYWPKARLVVELQSHRHHSGRDQFELDHAKLAALKRRGCDVLPLTYLQVTEDPRTVVATLEKLLGVSVRSLGGVRAGRPTGSRPRRSPRPSRAARIPTAPRSGPAPRAPRSPPG